MYYIERPTVSGLEILNNRLIGSDIVMCYSTQPHFLLVPVEEDSLESERMHYLIV